MESSKYFSISGFWKDTNENFEDHIIKETEYDEENDEDIDDLIFFYGLSEEEIKKAINLEWDTDLEFVITSYEETTL